MKNTLHRVIPSILLVLILIFSAGCAVSASDSDETALPADGKYFGKKVTLNVTHTVIASNPGE